MNILIVTDAYPPMRTSGASHIYDLGQALIQEGAQASIIVPASNQEQSILINQEDGVEIIRVKALHTKDVGYVRRTLAEFLNPFVMWHRLNQCPYFSNKKFDGLAWYSPTIFWGPLIRRLKKQFNVKAYLILRDIFPDWALDLGIMQKGPSYWFLKAVENFQYKQADVIGVQSPNNQIYLNTSFPNTKDKTKVFWNWIGDYQRTISCSIKLENSILSGRTICVYAGNMGKAQGIDSLFELAVKLRDNKEIGFVFVGRGSEVNRIREKIQSKSLSNVLLFDEIATEEIPGLYVQCDIGLVVLDIRHRTHNLPGKWMGYLQAGLPVFAVINPGNDMVELIQHHELGYVSTTANLSEWSEGLLDLSCKLSQDIKISDRCRELGRQLFSAQRAARQLIASFDSNFASDKVPHKL